MYREISDLKQSLRDLEYRYKTEGVVICWVCVLTPNERRWAGWGGNEASGINASTPNAEYPRRRLWKGGIFGCRQCVPPFQHNGSGLDARLIPTIRRDVPKLMFRISTRKQNHLGPNYLFLSNELVLASDL